MVAAARDGSQSAREARGGSGERGQRSKASHASGVQQGTHTQNFTRLVERTTEAFVGGDDSALEDVRRTLLQVRQQYDAVHHEAEQREAKLRTLREAISAADSLHSQQGDETGHLDEKWRALQQQFSDTMKRIKDTQTSRKVYEHMLARIQKEQAVLKQKMLRMEEHLARKKRDVHRRAADGERLTTDKVCSQHAFEALSEDADHERANCRIARELMEGEMNRRREANRRKAKFDSWRHTVALDAANEAFNASAGRLRKLYAIEKLCGNSLQKITFEQVERSQNTEDGFQKIREVTGLTDVMDIVHKFLNRDVEHEQLKGSVKDAEVRLEALRQDFDAFKRDTEGITFDQRPDSDGSIYKEVERSERVLNEAMQEHEACRARLQRTTLAAEHMKRWAVRVGQLLSSYEEPVKVESPADLGLFFKRLESVVERFVESVEQQIKEGKITRKALLKAMTEEYNDQTKTLMKQDFIRSNCRVPAAADAPRPTSRQGTAEDDPNASFSDDRERFKGDSENVVRAAQAEQAKRGRPKGGPAKNFSG